MSMIRRRTSQFLFENTGLTTLGWTLKNIEEKVSSPGNYDPDLEDRYEQVFPPFHELLSN